MAHAKGTFLGGIRSLADLKDRCYIDPDSGCWCWRRYVNEDGFPYMRLLIGGKAMKSMGRRAALLLSGRLPQPGMVAYPAERCFEPSCVNPEHARWGTTAQRMRQAAARGSFDSPERRANLVALNKARAKLRPEQRLWVELSSGPRDKIARDAGISPGRVSQLRHGAVSRGTATNVFEWRPF